MGEEEATILVVEDERELADTFARWLGDDYSVRVAYTGEDAIAELDDSVDVVLLDRRLPDIPGGDVLSHVREHGYDCRIAVITAVDPDFDILEMPFDDYVVKPILKDDVREIVERLLELATFDDRLQESYALASKISVLEAEKGQLQLEENEEFQESKARLRRLREEIDDTLSSFEAEDFESTYRDLDDGGADFG